MWQRFVLGLLLLLPDESVLSSEPILPSGLVPAVRTMADCLPP
jgi:hypothetical protein